MVYMKCNFRRRGVDRIECLLQNQRVTPYLRRCACFPHSIMAGGCHCHSGSSFKHPCGVGLSIRTGSVRFSIFLDVFSIFFRFHSIYFSNSFDCFRFFSIVSDCISRFLIVFDRVRSVFDHFRSFLCGVLSFSIRFRLVFNRFP